MRKVSIMRKITAIALSVAMLFGLNPGVLALAAETISTSQSEVLRKEGVPKSAGIVSATFSYVDGASVSVTEKSYGTIIYDNDYSVTCDGAFESGRPDEWKYVYATFTFNTPEDYLIVRTSTVGCSIYGELY